MTELEQIKKNVWDNGGNWINTITKEHVVKVISYKQDRYLVVSVDEYLANENDYCFVMDAKAMGPMYSQVNC